MIDDPFEYQYTLNRMGISALKLNKLTESFVAYAATCQGPVMDIGAGIGTATIAALEQGAKVIATDIMQEHLDIIRQHTPPHCLERLTLKLERFPEPVERAPASIDAVLMAWLLHFFTGPEIIQGLKQVYTWLKPQGKVFISLSTPYQTVFKPLIPFFEQRLAVGDKWPGFFADIREYGVYNDTVPVQMNLFIPPIISRALTEAGFKVENSDYYLDWHYPASARFDGRETILAIATK